MRKTLIGAIWLVVAVASGWWLSPAGATIVTLLDENFDDVTGLPAATSVRTIADIWTNSPGQLPPGTTWSPGFPATSVGLNVRRGDNAINTSTGSSGFNSFFGTSSSNRFLVLGDDAGAIGGAPDTGTRTINFPFTIPQGAFLLDVSFDFAFDGTDTNNLSSPNDTLRVFLTPSPPTGDVLNISSGFIPLFGQFSGSFSQTFSVPADIPVGPATLSFRLFEDPSAITNTAAGFDNIKVTAAVPEPTILTLLGIGIIVLWASRRRR